MDLEEMADNSAKVPPPPEAERKPLPKARAWDMGTLYAVYIPEPLDYARPQPEPSSQPEDPQPQDGAED